MFRAIISIQITDRHHQTTFLQREMQLPFAPHPSLELGFRARGPWRWSGGICTAIWDTDEATWHVELEEWVSTSEGLEEMLALMPGWERLPRGEAA